MILQVLDIATLVRGSAFPQNLQERIPDLGFGQGTIGNLDVQVGQMPAIQMLLAFVHGTIAVKPVLTQDELRG